MRKNIIINDLVYKIQLLDRGDLLNVLNHTENILRNEKYNKEIKK
jgi:hypothetical protein